VSIYGDDTPLWSEAQITSALRILHQVRRHQLGSGAELLAIACAITESQLLVLSSDSRPMSKLSPWRQGDAPGDATSVGLFQQQDPWGSIEHRMNPYGATARFLQGGDTGEPGLLAQHDWRDRDPAEVISDVQRNRDGARSYVGSVTRGRGLLAALTSG